LYGILENYAENKKKEQLAVILHDYKLFLIPSLAVFLI